MKTGVIFHFDSTCCAICFFGNLRTLNPVLIASKAVSGKKLPAAFPFRK